VKALAALALILGSPVMAAPMHYADFQKLAQPPAPGPILAYGADPLQHVELWKPKGKGPFPVVLMLHGGCWQTAVAKADIMHMAAADLMKHGIAAWNVEYRGVDVPGGGYPGTFQDVAAAADMLGREGQKLGLDTRHVVAIGHSAGGHLALWLAGRHNIARSSVLWAAHPLPIASVVSAGGLPDLAQTKADATEACGVDTVDKLVGPVTSRHPNVYADTSAVALVPLGIPQRLVVGVEDPIAPIPFSESYRKVAAGKGDQVSVTSIPDSGHFELITPTTPAWQAQIGMIEDMLKPHPRPR
jgi:acetyl esterase/lipase